MNCPQCLADSLAFFIVTGVSRFHVISYLHFDTSIRHACPLTLNTKLSFNLITSMTVSVLLMRHVALCLWSLLKQEHGYVTYAHLIDYWPLGRQVLLNWPVPRQCPLIGPMVVEVVVEVVVVAALFALGKQWQLKWLSIDSNGIAAAFSFSSFLGQWSSKWPSLVSGAVRPERWLAKVLFLFFSHSHSLSFSLLGNDLLISSGPVKGPN